MRDVIRPKMLPRVDPQAPVSPKRMSCLLEEALKKINDVDQGKRRDYQKAQKEDQSESLHHGFSFFLREFPFDKKVEHQERKHAGVFR